MSSKFLNKNLVQKDANTSEQCTLKDVVKVAEINLSSGMIGVNNMVALLDGATTCAGDASIDGLERSPTDGVP